MVADCLAKQFFDTSPDITANTYYEAPSFVVDLLHADTHGPHYVRRVRPASIEDPTAAQTILHSSRQ